MRLFCDDTGRLGLANVAPEWTSLRMDYEGPCGGETRLIGEAVVRQCGRDKKDV